MVSSLDLSLKAQEPGVLMSKDQEKNNVPAQEETVNFFFLCLFVLFRPSVDWIMPVHISKDGLLYSAY